MLAGARSLGHVLDGVRRALGLALVNQSLPWLDLGVAARALTSENDKGPCRCKDLVIRGKLKSATEVVETDVFRGTPQSSHIFSTAWFIMGGPQK